MCIWKEQLKKLSCFNIERFNYMNTIKEFLFRQNIHASSLSSGLYLTNPCVDMLCAIFLKNCQIVDKFS